MKRCFICKERKPLGEFYLHPMMADGHLNKCKECTKDQLRIDRLDLFKRAAILARDNAREKTPERKTYAADRQRRYRAANRDKYLARGAVNNAIRDGRLVRQSCEICGEVAQAHHSDYSKPFEIRWLCFKCHRQVEHGQKVGV